VGWSTITYKTDAACVDYVYTIDRANKRMIGTRTKKPNVGDECSIAEARPMSLSVSNGYEVWRRLGEEERATVLPYL
jgi:hypothetical protein